MKKFAALTLCLLMIFSLTACGGFNERKLIGNWDTEISMEDFMAITGEDDLGLDDDTPKAYRESIKDVKIAIRFAFYKDGTCEVLFSEKAYNKFVDSIIDALAKYLKDGGLLETFKAEGITTQEEMEAALTLIGSSVDDMIEQIKTEAKTEVSKNKEEIFEGYTLKDGYYSDGIAEFTLDEKKITLIYGKDGKEEKELMYYELVDDDTLKLTKIIADYEEYDCEIILNRVK